MAALTQRGLIHSIGAIQTRQYKDKTYVSRAVVIEQPRIDQYTGEKLGSNFIKLEATKDDICKSLDGFSVGNKVDVEFALRGSEYDKKDGSGKDVFTHIELRSVTLVASARTAPAPAAAPIPAAPAPAPAPAPSADEYDSELGF